MRDRATEKLRRFVERPHMREMYGRKYKVRPRLVSAVFGDGRELMILTPMQGNPPNYFVVRVGDGWCEEGWRTGGNNAPVRAHLDDIYTAIEDEFGTYVEEDGDPPRFPDRVPVREGCRWGTMDWPKGCGPKQVAPRGPEGK